MAINVPESLDIGSLRLAYAEGLDPTVLISTVLKRIEMIDDSALFLALADSNALRARCASLQALGPREKASQPLFGIPFAVKDNIDVRGLPTTAACPAYSYMPQTSARAVELLEAAGAIVIGKTNLDQFATGLVGTRSPYGTPRNAFDARIIPGGSSSGSATSVAWGSVSFALGTDTAGSGRVPAGLNNLVGLKPTPGLISSRGMLPACRTLDCISIFALTVDDAFAVLKVIGLYDQQDAFSRPIPLAPLGAAPAKVRFGVPLQKDRHFFGDTLGEKVFVDALAQIEALGHELIEVDFEPLFAVARLLYEGPWVAERYAVIGDFLETHPDALHPVTQAIIMPAKTRSAVEAFQSHYRLMDARRAAEQLWDQVDALIVPTVPRPWTLTENAADPIGTNSALGTYTNFVNLLGMAALAVPIAIRSDNIPAGITLISAGGCDAWLASVGRRIEAVAAPPLGATKVPRRAVSDTTLPPPQGMIAVALFGAHMSGLPLNKDILKENAVFLRTVKTAPVYRFYALAGGPPFRPGLIKVKEGGAAIDAELWAISPEGLGHLMATIPAPLGIGTVTLDDGDAVKGFICEGIGIDGATDITHFGGWRAYLAAR